MTQSNVFKFRAECFRDVREFISLLPNVQCISLNVTPLYFQNKLDGQEVTIETGGYGITQLVNIMKKIIDTHVMMETIQPIEKYTGERTDQVYDTLTN